MRQQVLLNPNNLIIFSFFLFGAVLLSSCSKEEPEKKFVARVNDAYLTEEELAEMAGSGAYSKLNKEEIIRNWVKREVLFQEAQREGLLDEPEYQRLIESSRRELASSMMLKKVFDEESFIYEQKDIEEFFEKNKRNYQRFYDSYLLNIAVFNDEDKAIRFRQTAVESDWNKSVNVFSSDSSVISMGSNVLYYEQDINPALLLRIVKELYEQEISIILSFEKNRFTVVQLVDKYEAGTIPPFEIIKKSVEDNFLVQRKSAMLNDYLKELYSDSEIEVKKY